MTDILDLIDNAIWDSGDAMRWSPNPPEPSRPRETAEHQLAQTGRRVVQLTINVAGNLTSTLENLRAEMQRMLTLPGVLSLRATSDILILEDPQREPDVKAEARARLTKTFQDTVAEIRAMAEGRSTFDAADLARLQTVRDKALKRLGDSRGRVPYLHLEVDEQTALHDWCQLHSIDHTLVPIDPLIERDGPEWRIEVLALRGGRGFLDNHGDIATIILRRVWKADLPWRTVQ